jgi:NADH dehydrogenase/NADH:ubiquinone oxidoreductase subunit G
LAKRYGIKKSHFALDKDEEASYCTLCRLCIRYYREVVGENAVGFVGRGVDRKGALLPEKGDTCVFCRKCYKLFKGGIFPELAEGFPELL